MNELFQSGFYQTSDGQPFHVLGSYMSAEQMRAIEAIVKATVDGIESGKLMECALWNVDSHGEWSLFYGYTGFHYAIVDARGTLGIDIWAIVRRTTVIAMSTNAAPYIQSLSTMLKQNARGRS